MKTKSRLFSIALWLATMLSPQASCPPNLTSYSRTMDPGYTTLVNHLGAASLSTLLGPVPPGTGAFRFVSGNFVGYFNDEFSGEWSADPTINPGEGIIIDNYTSTPFTTVVSGTLATSVPLNLPPGFHLLGRVGVGEGTFESIVGRPPGDYSSAVVYRLDPAGVMTMGQWNFLAVHTFQNNTWSPSAPVLDVGEAAFFQLGAQTGNSSFVNGANGIMPGKGPDCVTSFTLNVTGFGFQSGDTVFLRNNNASVPALSATPDDCGFVLTAVFDLSDVKTQGVVNGPYDVVIYPSGCNNINCATVLPNAFNLVSCIGVELLGRGIVGVGRYNPYALRVVNHHPSAAASGVDISFTGLPAGETLDLSPSASMIPLPVAVPGGFTVNGISLNPGEQKVYAFGLTADLTLLNQTFTVNGNLVAPYAGLDTLAIQVVGSQDPNDKMGPVGVGSAHHVTGYSPFNYVIQFENQPSASAPAQDVVITDQLDTTRLDVTSFSLGPITFGAQVVTPPAGVQTYSTSVPFDNSGNQVNIDVTFDNVISSPTFGKIAWTFRSVDPAGLPILNPLIGFLPANVTAPEGQGAVSFQVLPHANLLSGAAIQNGASITFDFNPAIITPTWLNTIDKDRPASTVQSLPATTGATTFTVNWSGSDSESGIATYDVFVSDNNGPYTAFVTASTATSATFVGQDSHNYRFYSQATDQIGHVEQPPIAEDASTTVNVSVSASDSDGDDLPDSWENANGLNANDASDAALDADVDGHTNLQEYLAGTDPNDPLSQLRIDLLTMTAAGPQISFTARANKTYSVLFKNAIDDPAWQKVSDVPAQTSDHVEQITDPAASTAQRFYRLVTPKTL